MIRPQPALSIPVRVMLLPGIAGAVAGMVAVAGLLLADIAHLRTLIAATGEPWVPVMMLIVGFVVTFASIAMGASIIALGEEE
jgi:hypothetical protein